MAINGLWHSKFMHYNVYAKFIHYLQYFTGNKLGNHRHQTLPTVLPHGKLHELLSLILPQWLHYVKTVKYIA